MPFRQAHEVAGRVVQRCIGVGKRIEESVAGGAASDFPIRSKRKVYNYLSADVGGRAPARAGRHVESNVVRRLKELRI